LLRNIGKVLAYDSIAVLRMAVSLIKGVWNPVCFEAVGVKITLGVAHYT